MDMDQVQRKDINNLMNDSLSKELDIHIGEYDEESKEYTFNINPFNYATVECNNWIMDFDELSKSYVPSEDSIIFLFNDKVKLSELSLKHISRVVLSFTVENCIVDSVGFGGSVIDFIEVNNEGDISVSLDLSKYSVNELVKLFSDDLFSIVVVLSNNLNESNSVLKDWNIQFTFKDLLLDEKEATKNRIEEFTETTYLKKSDIIDTGWVDLPLTNDFKNYSDNTRLRYRQMGGIVYIKGIILPKRNINVTSRYTDYKICDIPSSIAPTSIHRIIQQGYDKAIFQLNIAEQGLSFRQYRNGETTQSQITTSDTLNIYCSYCLEEGLMGMINEIISGVGDYNTLTNKPTINGQTLIGDTVLNIPTNLSDLNQDTTHKTVTDSQILEWNNKSNFDGDYNSLTNKPNIDDMATESWVNQQGFLTEAPVVSVNSKIGNVVLTPSDLGLGSVFKVKGSKPTKNDLPTTNNEIGDVWYVINESVGYIWLNDGTTNRWEQLGLEVDLSNYATITQLNNSLLNYVEKVTGKELSSNDFTDSLKNKLEGLSNYDDTDVWATLQELEINKQNTLVSGSNIKTINNQSLLGSGNITIQGGGGGTTDYNDLDNKPSINDEPLIGNRELMDYDIKDTTQIYGEDLWQNDINANLYDEIQSLKNNKEDKITKKTTSGTYFTAYKQLDIVSVYMNRSNYSPTKNTWVTLGNLADGFRPLQDIYMEYQDFRIRIQTGGAIQVYTANTPITILFNITYIN